MQFIIHDDGTWSIRGLHALEKLLLERIIEASDPEDDERAMQRLFPSLLGRPALDDFEEEQINEWNEYVQPDLRNKFNADLNVVEKDLKRFETTRSKHGLIFSLNVKKAHADAWCSALNQARIVLHERFDLPDPDNPKEDEEGEEMEGKWMAMLQSEIYGHVLEFLVTRILWLK